MSNPEVTISLTAPANKQRDANRQIPFSLAAMRPCLARAETAGQHGSDPVRRIGELVFPEGHRLHRVGRHAFRHLAVTRWLRAGVPLRTAARWGGWSDVATMLRWYESRLPGDDELAAGRLAACVGEHNVR